MTSVCHRDATAMGRSLIQEPGFLIQVYCMLVVCGTSLITSFSNGWPTLIATLVKDNSTSVDLDHEDIKWLVMSGGIVGFLGPFFAGALSDAFGPRSMLVVTTTLPVILCPMLSFLPSKPVIWASRIGICGASYMALNITTSLSAELVSPNIRGMLGSLLLIYYWVGIMTMFLLIKYLSWNLVCLVVTCPVAVIMIALCSVPESPYWLLRRGREEDARLALETLRGRGTDVENELENCKTGLEQQTSYTIRDEKSITEKVPKSDTLMNGATTST